MISHLKAVDEKKKKKNKKRKETKRAHFMIEF